MQLNPEQKLGVEHVHGPILILAGAGSGKTRVLTERIVFLIKNKICHPSEIFAVTFTNKAAKEMRTRVEKTLGARSDIWLFTFHSACVRILRAKGELIGLNPHFVIFDDSDQISLAKKILLELNISDKILTPRSVIEKISRAKDSCIDSNHYPDGDFYHAKIASVYRRYEEEMRKNGAVDFGDLLLLTVKLFSTNPEVLEYYQNKFKFIMVDEYQDTNHSQYKLLTLLAAKHKNICVVGDPDQCLPTGTLVMTPYGPKKIEKIKHGEEVISGAGWGKTSVATVNKVATKKFRGDLLRIGLRSGKSLLVTGNHICFGRLDPLPGMYYVYLMWRKGMGYRVGTTSGVRSSKDRVLLNGINVRTNQEVADAVWILRASRDFGEIRFYEQFYSLKYGVPTMVFHVRGRRMAINQEWIDQLFADIDTERGARRLMHDLHIDPRYPHHRPGAVIRDEIHRKHIFFTMFGGARAGCERPWHEHRIQLVTSDKKLRLKASKRFAVRDGQKGTWRIETSRKDYDDALKLAQAVSSLDNLEVISRARLTKDRPFFFMPASHLRIGMTVPTLENNKVVEDAVENIESVPFEGKVYDLSVSDLRNYSAEGVFVHNSIYAWRGADISNILEFEKEFEGAKVVKLEQNYRSTKCILAASDAVIVHNKGRKEKKLWTENEDGDLVTVVETPNEREEARNVVAEIKKLKQQGTQLKEMAIFYRTNAQSRVFEDELRREGVPYTIFGGTRFYDRLEIKNIIAYLRLIHNPSDDVSLKRVINVPARGIGKTTVDKLFASAAIANVPVFEFITKHLNATDFNSGTLKKLSMFAILINSLKSLAELPLADLVSEAIKKTKYVESLTAENTDEATERIANIDELISAVSEACKTTPNMTLIEFLDQVALVSGIDRYDETEDVLPMMTLHLAKGLEFPYVFIVGLEEGVLPHARSIDDEDGMEEERRLFYVGMTRAEKALYLCHANERMIRGGYNYNVPSRFLEEIPEEFVKRPFVVKTAAPEYKQSYQEQESDDFSQIPHDNAFNHKQVTSYESQITGFRVGQRVRHPTFGDGIVRKTEGSVGQQKLIVQFNSGELKKLVAQYANLSAI